MKQAVSITAIILSAGCSTGVEESRVAAMESRALELESEVAAAQAANASLEARLEALESAPKPASEAALSGVAGDVTALTQTVDGLASSQDNLTGRLVALETSDTVQLQQIGEAEGTLLTLTAALAELEEEVTGVEDSLLKVDPDSVSCPDGMVDVALADYCIDAVKTVGNVTTAPGQCMSNGRRLCSAAEWQFACGIGYIDVETDAPEFVADFVDGSGQAKLVAKAPIVGCTTQGTGGTGGGNGEFRCCVTKAALVYGPAVTNE